MKLTLHVDWVSNETPYNIIKSNTINVMLPNKDFYYAFEAWLNLSKINHSTVNSCYDNIIGICYDIIEGVCFDILGLTEKMYRDGVYDIDDPIAEDENNASAVITVYI